MNNPYIMLVFLSVIIAAISQILLKKAAMTTYESYRKEYLNPYVIGGYSLLLLTTLINVFAFSKGVELKSGAIIETLGFVLVMVLSRAIFQERITKKRLAGNLLILLGIIIFHL